ncbi:pyruvate kinase [Halohasta litchfieldiae]|jgi:pyruvate kinase|uniref:Pyruvate kinase n=1 Tax=Halohasta litchfieldiae TaxID=1073996 RepID=A0A1H6UZ29_9EURY|nr:pyruvate kinase [Halohasta litchfieldiae]ATW87590.1 pyruvate kinase [Halohasta litchfieldiae]SEI97491.1 pyruvate kinase [Halohasta litchfieldiae]
MRNAKIVCTIGPKSDSPETLEALAEAGMSVARMNASHGTPDQRRTVIDRVREVDAKTDRPVAVMHDLPGPEIRTAPIEEKIRLEAGSTVRFVEGQEATPQEVGVSHSLTAVEPGDRILLDDGRIETTVQSVDEDSVTVTVGNGGELGGRKGVNVPGVELGLPTVTEQDRRELEVAADKEVDFVAASFVRDGEFIYEISDALEELGADIPIIAKIERDVAVDNIDSIIDAAYGVMVARGDLGVEMPLEDVPMTQKRIINKCRNAGVPVITATEMLDSMTENRRPTRAEASDVANAVLDGTDAVMLSGETAMGAHPPLVVETMDRIVRDVERSDEYNEIVEQNVPEADVPQTDALARSARYLVRDIDADAIVAASESGYTAQKVSKFRPSVPIVGSTPSDEVRRRLALSWGIISETTPYTSEGASAVIENAVQTGLETEAVDSGDTVVVLSGMMTELDSTSSSNTLKIHVAAETIGSGESVVDGVAVGAFHWVDSGDLSEIPEGAIVGVPMEFDGELSGDLEGIAGIVDCHGELASTVRTVARDQDIPTITSGDLTGEISDGEMVTLDAERGIIYRGEVDQLRSDLR